VISDINIREIVTFESKKICVICVICEKIHCIWYKTNLLCQSRIAFLCNRVFQPIYIILILFTDSTDNTDSKKNICDICVNCKKNCSIWVQKKSVLSVLSVRKFIAFPTKNIFVIYSICEKISNSRIVFYLNIIKFE
jgi:hypothetical protein